MDEIKKILKRYFSIIIILLIVMGLLNNKEQLSDVFSFWYKILTPFFLAIFISYILSPLEKFFEKKLKFKNKKRNKLFAITITYILFISVVTILGILCIPQIVTSLSELITKSPQLYNNLIYFISQYQEKYDLNLLKDFSNINTTLNKLFEYMTSILPNIVNWLTNFFKAGINMFMSIIISIYLMYEKENIFKNISRFCHAYLKKDIIITLKETYIDCESILNKFIMGKLIDSIIIGILCAIIMLILKLDYIVLISFFVGFTNMIPYIGPFIGGSIGVVLLFIVNPKDAFIFLIVILCLQQFDGCILGPKILGGKIGLKPLWILVSLLIGGALGGIVGMFLGTPIIAMIIDILDKNIEKRLKKQKENNKESS